MNISGSTTTVLAILVIGWILFIITLVGCATVNAILIYSRRLVSETKRWVCNWSEIYACNYDNPACCWYRTPQECTGNKESKDVYDNPDDLTKWAHVACNDGCGHVCTTYIGVHMNRWRWQNVLLTILTNHNTLLMCMNKSLLLNATACMYVCMAHIVCALQ